MTKLTKEQIEQEQVKFEKWINDYFGYDQSFTKITTNLFHGYTDHQLTVMWHAWIVRAELDKGE